MKSFSHPRQNDMKAMFLYFLLVLAEFVLCWCFVLRIFKNGFIYFVIFVLYFISFWFCFILFYFVSVQNRRSSLNSNVLSE
jgi:membrane protein implicated in regulation of membrane protease activity